MRETKLLARWRAIDQLLQQHRKLWQYRPFDFFDFPWREDFPELAAWLDQQELPHINLLDLEPTKLIATVIPYLPKLLDLPELISLPSINYQAGDVVRRTIYRIPHRKLQQIKAFAGAAKLELSPQVVEWCAGKGHLGRLVAANSRTAVTSLEIDEQLCAQGQQLAQRAGVSMQFEHCDVMDSEVTAFMTPDVHVAALHACGHLHRRLLNLAIRCSVGRLSFAPCCYHIGVEQDYEPLSIGGSLMSICLSAFDLKLALQETVTANKRTIRLRDKELNWRLAFDALQRDLRGQEQYATIPSAKESQLSQEFPDFCSWAAQQIGVSLPQDVDFQKYLAAGKRRRLDIARMEIVRHVFRRVLELWLVFDLVRFLEENDYDVALAEFCDKSITPRNILIDAVKR